MHCGRMRANFAQLARSISLAVFHGRISADVPLDEVVSAVITTIPAIRDAGEVETQIFADGLLAALREETFCENLVAARRVVS